MPTVCGVTGEVVPGSYDPAVVLTGWDFEFTYPATGDADADIELGKSSYTLTAHVFCPEALPVVEVHWQWMVEGSNKETSSYPEVSPTGTVTMALPAGDSDIVLGPFLVNMDGRSRFRPHLWKADVSNLNLFTFVVDPADFGTNRYGDVSNAGWWRSQGDHGPGASYYLADPEAFTPVILPTTEVIGGASVAWSDSSDSTYARFQSNPPPTNATPKSADAALTVALISTARLLGPTATIRAKVVRRPAIQDLTASLLLLTDVALVGSIEWTLDPAGDGAWVTYSGLLTGTFESPTQLAALNAGLGVVRVEVGPATSDEWEVLVSAARVCFPIRGGRPLRQRQRKDPIVQRQRGVPGLQQRQRAWW